MVEKIKHPKAEVKIGIVGKYTDWRDSYKSLSEALVHGGVANDVRVHMLYIDSEELEKGINCELLNQVDGILVPGGFGERGIEGKIQAINHARIQKIPYFGICLGMQLAVIAFARFVCGMKSASSAEFRPDGKENVVDLMESQKELSEKGGTMRLGAYPCQVIQKVQEGSGGPGLKTRAYSAYQKESISERHRHRYEVSNRFLGSLQEKGLIVSGKYTDSSTGAELVEMIELADHPWFLGCQFHPEFLSRPLRPHPLFASFIKAAANYERASK